jgi:hypothetical protein
MKGVGLLFIAFLLLSCNKKGTKENASRDTGSRKITYQESTEDFVNPERGFYRAASTLSSDFTPLDKSRLISYRKEELIPGTQYRVLSSLLYRVYILDDFKDRPLSEEFLKEMSADFETAREAGIKIILRFSYDNETHSGGCPVKSICPPYGDAPLSVVLEQIAQLKPYLQENADIIECVQEGFIGIWGENYYSDYFGDASPNGGRGKFLDSNWVDRNKVLKALLDAVPKDRMIQVRTPQIKQRYVYGISAPISSPALAETEAFTGSDKARIGFHNDAFLSGPSDQGTYEDYGNSSSPPGADAATINTLKDYVKAESKFVVVGGETDNPSYSPQNGCGPGGIAEQEMRDLHYTFLNSEYQQAVIGGWAQGGCLNTIKTKLGYRLMLDDATFPLQVNPGGTLAFSMDLENTGYAAPIDERPVQLILRDSETGKIVTLDIDINIRKWYPGPVAVTDTLSLPSDVPAGMYELLLNMPDKYPSISKRPEYSIRLANTDIWEEATGYNKLKDSIEVK